MAKLTIMQRLLGRVPEQKVSAAGTAIVATHVGAPVWTSRDYAKFADEGYIRNAIAFRCISMIAQAGAFIPLLLRDKKSKKIIEDHGLLTLLNNPAPQTTGVEWMERLITYLKIAGNSYGESVGPDRLNAPPKELYVLRPDRMRIIAGPDATPGAYEYEVNGRKVRWPVDRITGFSNVLHLKSFHPNDDWYGLSSIEPAAFAVDRHNEAGAHNMAVLQNGAVPSGALAFKPITVDGASVNAPPEIIAAAEKKLEERHQGARNSGRPFVLGGNVDWLTFGQTMEQLQLVDSKLDAARDICTALGVPFILLVPGQSTYNNNREAKLALYEETILPLMSWLLDHLNVWLTPRFGDNLELILDIDSIDALSIRRDEKRTTYGDLFSKRVVTRSEFREALGFQPLPNVAEFEPQSHEVTAIVQLMNGNKLSIETGVTQLKLWGLVPPNTDPEAEVERISNEGGSTDGLTGIDGTALGPDGKPLPIDPVTGKPLPPKKVP